MHEDLKRMSRKSWPRRSGRCATAFAVPAWPEFLAGCIRYRQSLDKE